MSQADNEPDGIDHAMSDTVRTTGMVAGYVAQQGVIAMEQQARQQARDADDRTRDMRDRINTDRRIALAQLAPTRQPNWWRTAELTDMVQTWQTARTWSHAYPHAEAIEHRIARAVQQRYGIDLRAVGANYPDALNRQGAGYALAGPAQDRPDAGNSREAVAMLVADAAHAAHASAPAPSTETHQVAGGAGAGSVAPPQHNPKADDAREIAAVNQAFPAENALSVPLDRDRLARGPRLPTPRQRPPELGGF